MATALVTGATGFVGGAVARELVARGWQVRALVRPGSVSSAGSCRTLEGCVSRIDCVTGDLRDRESLRRGIDGCDTVFHVAARYTLWNPDKREIYRDNVDGTRNVLEVSAELGVKKIVYTSTVGVLKAPKDNEIGNEASRARLTEVAGHYKQSKWLADECARDLATQGVPVVIVNPSTPVGPYDVKPTPTGLMIVDFLSGKMPGYTNTGLNLVSVEDVAVGHILAAEKGVPGESYILGAENLSLKEIFAILSKLTGLRPPRIRVPRRLLIPLSTLSTCWAYFSRRPPLIPWEAAAMAQKHMYFDCSRARRELGFAPSSVTDALQRAVLWFRDNNYVRPARAHAITRPAAAERGRPPVNRNL